MKVPESGLMRFIKRTNVKIIYDERVPIDEAKIVCRQEDYFHIKKVIKAEGIFGNLRALPSWAVLLWKYGFRK
ncbi:unnamed protein product [Cuscuta epithymum]|uniref:Uncharacterized protein n=1 Tax=Cuscuta epithymum TaxID=186058 RepID=A0AAV0C7U2_9ASTE|nr:unnamed protein product [Cuscuta epithymum]